MARAVVGLRAWRTAAAKRLRETHLPRREKSPRRRFSRTAGERDGGWEGEQPYPPALVAMTSAVVEGETAKELSGACSRRATRHRRDPRALRRGLRADMVGSGATTAPRLPPSARAPLPSRGKKNTSVNQKYAWQVHAPENPLPLRLDGHYCRCFFVRLRGAIGGERLAGGFCEVLRRKGNVGGVRERDGGRRGQRGGG